MVYSKVNVTELEFFLFGGGGTFVFLFFTKRQYVYRSKKKKSTRVQKSRLLRVISMLKSQSGNININLNNDISIPNWEGGIKVTPPPPVRRVEQILTILPDHSRGRWSAASSVRGQALRSLVPEQGSLRRDFPWGIMARGAPPSPELT